jgi:hypothetical protein
MSIRPYGDIISTHLPNSLEAEHLRLCARQGTSGGCAAEMLKKQWVVERTFSWLVGGLSPTGARL